MDNNNKKRITKKIKDDFINITKSIADVHSHWLVQLIFFLIETGGIFFSVNKLIWQYCFKIGLFDFERQFERYGIMESILIFWLIPLCISLLIFFILIKYSEYRQSKEQKKWFKDAINSIFVVAPALYVIIVLSWAFLCFFNTSEVYINSDYNVQKIALSEIQGNRDYNPEVKNLKNNIYKVNKLIKFGRYRITLDYFHDELGYQKMTRIRPFSALYDTIFIDKPLK
ncbi:MAG: hypothetical protein GF353_21275 [Candidatus Lokiarchaeota archaeon]|nr:hypothetical protein [Candidatus Lokiarchaeota archaeon]